MMRSFIVFMFLVAPSAVFAKGNMNIQRGGVGFLFPDHNSLVNPGQFATTHGSGLQFGYQASTTAGSAQAASSTFVYGNGTFGIGVGAMRTAVDLLQGASVDFLQGGLGFGLMKERMTIGASFGKSMTGVAGDDSTVSGAITFNGARRMGATVGVGYSRVLASGAHSGRIGLGYGFQSNNNLEFNLSFADLSNFNAWAASAYFTVAKNMFFLGAGYTYTAVGQTHDVGGRLGFVLGGSFDLSGTASYTVSSSAFTYGGMLRAAF